MRSTPSRRRFVNVAAAVRLLGAVMFFSALSARAMSEYELLRSFPPGRLAAIGTGDKPSPEGLSGANRINGAWLEAGPQRGSCRAVVTAVVNDDLAAADEAWRGVDVAFAHQRGDGGFEAATRPNGESARAPAAAVETAYFFLQELGRTILIIRESPHEAHFHDRIASLEPKIRRGCDFIAAGYDSIIQKSSHAVNRIVIAAKAFGTCGLVLHDESLVATSRRLVAHALTLRDGDGVFIENGGRDSSYNVVSILYGQQLALHVPLPDLEAALPAAVGWELTRVLATGEVDVRGNTRTGVGREKSYTGQPKNVNYNEVALALTYYGLIRHDDEALGAAARVFTYSRTNHPGPRPGAP